MFSPNHRRISATGERRGECGQELIIIQEERTSEEDERDKPLLREAVLDMLQEL